MLDKIEWECEFGATGDWKLSVPLGRGGGWERGRWVTTTRKYRMMAMSRTELFISENVAFYLKEVSTRRTFALSTIRISRNQ